MSAQRVVAEVREAATVVLLRRAELGASDPAPRIYMVRRSARSTFMPDTLVFPGGRVEHIDLDGDGETDDSAFEAAAKSQAVLDVLAKRNMGSFILTGADFDAQIRAQSEQFKAAME